MKKDLGPLAGIDINFVPEIIDVSDEKLERLGSLRQEEIVALRDHKSNIEQLLLHHFESANPRYLSVYLNANHTGTIPEFVKLLDLGNNIFPVKIDTSCEPNNALIIHSHYYGGPPGGGLWFYRWVSLKLNETVKGYTLAHVAFSSDLNNAKQIGTRVITYSEYEKVLDALLSIHSGVPELDLDEPLNPLAFLGPVSAK